MPITTKPFEAQMDNWVRQSEARMLAVFRESAQRTVSMAQSYLVPHIDTGFLRASIRGSLQSMPKIQKYPGAVGQGGDVTMTIAGAQLGSKIYVGYTANYAAHLEYGTKAHIIRPRYKKVLRWFVGGASVFSTFVRHPGTKPVAYVGRAAARWRSTVRAVTQDLKNYVKSQGGS